MSKLNTSMNCPYEQIDKEIEFSLKLIGNDYFDKDSDLENYKQKAIEELNNFLCRSEHFNGFEIKIIDICIN